MCNFLFMNTYALCRVLSELFVTTTIIDPPLGGSVNYEKQGMIKTILWSDCAVLCEIQQIFKHEYTSRSLFTKHKKNKIKI